MADSSSNLSEAQRLKTEAAEQFRAGELKAALRTYHMVSTAKGLRLRKAGGLFMFSFFSFFFFKKKKKAHMETRARLSFIDNPMAAMMGDKTQVC